jgi:phage major head subunit gpT-like protein
MSDWSDEDGVKYSPMSDATYQLTNKKYAAGLLIRRDDIMDEQTGGIALRIRDLARVAQRYSDRLLVDALEDATSTGYDGVVLFSNTHTARGNQSAAQDNLLGTSGTATANIVADLNSVIAALGGFLGENNEPVNDGFRELWIVAPWALRNAFKEEVRAQIISSTSNVQFDDMKVHLHFEARLASATAWYAGVYDTPIKALVWQDREPVSFEALEGGSDIAFERELYAYKARMRGRAGIGKWHGAVKVA